MKKLLAGLHALTTYALGMASLLSLFAFLLDVPVPFRIDGPPVRGTVDALLYDAALLFAFLVPHSIMARPGFKAMWTRFVPPHLERATYIGISGLTLFALLGLWSPAPNAVWQVETAAAAWPILALYGFGWLVIVVSTFTIDHFAFFGLAQVWAYLRDRAARPVPFTTRWFYALVRHPISAGWLLVFWSTPAMSAGHLLMAAVMTAYILAVTPIEERDLAGEIGEPYRAYRARVRAFLPIRPGAAPPPSRAVRRPG